MQQQFSMNAFFGEPVSVYTREMAINDGVLVDITDTAKEAGFSIPVAVTNSVWHQYIEWNQDDNAQQCHQDQAARLWDIVWMARVGVIGTKDSTSETLFDFYCVRHDGSSKWPERTTLKIIIGPGDDGNPVLTILLPNED